MKRKILTILSVSFLLAMVSCDKELDSEGVNTKITYYPTFEMAGDVEVFHQLNTPYTDPAVTATEDSENLTVSVSVTGVYNNYNGATVKSDVADKYVITYSAINSDGYPGNTSRIVHVFKTGDFVTSIEGLYTATVIRTPTQGTVAPDKVLSYIIIWKNPDNSYGMSDGIGGYYELGRGLGYGYIAPGCTFNYDLTTSTFTAGSDFSVYTFGGSGSIVSMTVDPVAKTINYVSTWDSSYDFKVTLTQVQP